MSRLTNVKRLVPNQVSNSQQDVTAASGDVISLIRSGQIVLNTAGTPNVVMPTPQPGDQLAIMAIGAGAVTVTLPTGVTWDGTNRVATFGAGKALHVRAISTTRMFILNNVGTVTFS